MGPMIEIDGGTSSSARVQTESLKKSQTHVASQKSTRANTQTRANTRAITQNRRLTDNNIFNGTYSGADIIASILLPDSQPIYLGQLATISYSIYREKIPVRTLGRLSVKGFGKGPRTVAGTMVFVVLERHITNIIRDQIQYLTDVGRIKTDELPPFDMIITLANEYGSSAKLVIYGMTIVDEGKVLSVEDMFAENTMSYVARDIELMDDVQNLQMAGSSPSSHMAGSVDLAPMFRINDLLATAEAQGFAAALLKAEEDRRISERARQAHNDEVRRIQQNLRQGTPVNGTGTPPITHPPAPVPPTMPRNVIETPPPVGRVNVNVLVKDQANRAVFRARVVLRRGLSTIHDTFTATNGFVGFNIEAPARTASYTLVVSADGYLPQTRQVNISANSINNYEFNLQAKGRNLDWDLDNIIPIEPIEGVIDIPSGNAPSVTGRCVNIFGWPLSGVEVEVTYRISNLTKGQLMILQTRKAAGLTIRHLASLGSRVEAGTLIRARTGADGIVSAVMMPGIRIPENAVITISFVAKQGKITKAHQWIFIVK